MEKSAIVDLKRVCTLVDPRGNIIFTKKGKSEYKKCDVV